MAKQQYYELKRTIKLHPDAKYIIVYGERSNGKSYSGLNYVTDEFYQSLQSDEVHSFGYIRRWSDDIKTSNMEQVFKSILLNDNKENQIEINTKNEYNHVSYKSRCFYMDHIDESGNIDKKVEEPLGYVFSLSESERIKSTGYPTIKTIIFEEFISEGLPMVNEFTRFMSVLSTIIRNRDDVRIIMLGNTINKYNIYFNEFGLVRAKNQQKNTIDVYEYTDDDGKILKLACEYADFPDKKVKKSNIYFAFNKENNKMIRTGSWQIASYPHLTHRYRPKDIRMMYFISFDNELFQCEVIRVKDIEENRIINEDNAKYSKKNITFTYIHRKTTDIRDVYNHIIFKQDYDPHDNIRRKITNTYDDIGKFIYSFFTTEAVMYQDNEVGDAIHSYLDWCRYK